MFRNLVILVLSYFFFTTPVYSYEFSGVGILFDSLISDYTGDINFKNISLQGGKALNQIDSSLKIYNSDSKAFLYKNDNLIATFELPQNENPVLWKQLLSDILTTGMKRSLIVSQSPKTLENVAISMMTNNLDKYSRIEKTEPILEKTDFQIIDNILYINSTSFYKGFADYLEKIILTHPTITGVIMDLRNNHGGNFNEAIKTADLFLDDTLITYREDKDQSKRYYISAAGDILNGKPIVVLTNEETASSAEIVAGALYEQSRATLVGTKTYGKDTTQLTKQINEHKLFITNGDFYMPSGKRICSKGISPQICTGINNSCLLSDKKEHSKDIFIAINLIKKNFS